MKIFLVLFGTLCLLLIEIKSQGFVQPHDSTKNNIFRRQLTPVQQSNILNDIQQHQHRFNFHSPSQKQQQQQKQQQFLIQQQPSIEIPVAPTQQTIINQRPPPLSNSIRFPQNFNRQNANNNLINNVPIIQHHTQTNFIPNFQQTPQQAPQQNFQYQRSLQNQLNYPQQPFQPQPTQQIDFQAQNFLRNQYQQQQQGGGSSQSSNLPISFAPTQFQALPQFPANPQFQTSPQFQAAPNFGGQQIQSKGQFPPTGLQQQQQQIPQQSQYQPVANKQHFQVAPQFQTAPQFHISGQFQTEPQFPQFNSGSPPISKAEQEAKEKLIQKHEAFVQKQYEKQQSKVKQLHDEFLQKQQIIKQLGLTAQGGSLNAPNGQNGKSRGILPSERELFENAIKKYQEEHPTTTVTTTTTTAENDKNGVAKEDPFERLLQAQRKDIYAQLGLEGDDPKIQGKSSNGLGREDLLKQIKAALGDSAQLNLGNQAESLIQQSSGDGKKKTDDKLKQIAPLHSMDLVLPGGEKVEIVRAPDPSSVGGLTDLSGDISSLYAQSLGNDAKIISSDDGPPSIEELAKRGLIPEGYEIVQQPAPGSNAAAQQIAAQAAPAQPKAAPKKKPTYVYLEEQADGSFKVQGVKANGEKEAKTTGAEVDSILDQIKKGDIKLPPSVKKVQLPSEVEPEPPKTVRPLPRSTAAQPATAESVSSTTTTPAPAYVTFPSRTVSPYSTLSPGISSTSPTPISSRTNPSTVHLTTASSTYQPSTTPTYSSSISSTHTPVTERLIATTVDNEYPNQDKEKRFTSGTDLIQILKSNGLFAMAKYLKQSGLDSILNETGPYTVFAPTDKAFKNLLIQLGGPERAEEKFKANPRLLSGLLLHHVIPGSFLVSSLQDEMTGVSLAGTQLRVNQYSMHDQEWNDVLITTINGAMIVNEKENIKIPQGIAHGVDRVMFPLPVGDLLQTLQSDRERRFTNFLKILYSSGLSELLQNKGTKTYTVFAPTDKAFAELDPEDLQKLTNDKDASQAFAMRHIMPGTLYSAGMRFYQVKDSLLPGQMITLQKTSSGRIKVNDSQMITSNIPGTNGVIHALDGIL